MCVCCLSLVSKSNTYRFRARDDRNNLQRSLGQKGSRQVQPGRHSRRLEEARGRTNGHQLGAHRAQEVVHRVQGPREPGRLRDPRRHEPRVVLPVGLAVVVVVVVKIPSTFENRLNSNECTTSFIMYLLLLRFVICRIS